MILLCSYSVQVFKVPLASVMSETAARRRIFGLSNAHFAVDWNKRPHWTREENNEPEKRGNYPYMETVGSEKVG